MYNFQLDGEAILRRLAEGQADGMLQADIPLQVMFEVVGVRESGKVQVLFQKGNVVTCSLATAHKVLFTDKEQILHMLSRIGKLHWQLSLPMEGFPVTSVEASPAHYQQHSPLSATPYRIRMMQINRLPDMHERKVYQLIDGQRSIEKIAALAGMTGESTMIVVQKLQSYGIVGITDS